MRRKPIPIGPATVVRRVEGVSVTHTDDGLFLVDVRSGYLFRLNATGQLIWTLLENPATAQVLAEKVATQYDISPDQCLIDVLGLLHSLVDAGLCSVVST